MFDSAADISISCGGSTAEGSTERGESSDKQSSGSELERKDLEAEAAQALKACRPNSALTVREVQEDVHRIINSGYFSSCMPVAVDTRDGIRLVFQVCSLLLELSSPFCNDFE